MTEYIDTTELWEEFDRLDKAAVEGRKLWNDARCKENAVKVARMKVDWATDALHDANTHIKDIEESLAVALSAASDMVKDIVTLQGRALEADLALNEANERSAAAADWGEGRLEVIQAIKRAYDHNTKAKQECGMPMLVSSFGEKLDDLLTVEAET